ncbi:hypothetical protein EV401DRAFT_2011055 [Pisolithus croceorrhizus]|nr:hypothetical protein EV401DRAFT_2011055 [Pisolithus croceorrhizus]
MMVTRTAVAAWWSMCVSAVLQGMRGDPVAIDATPLESRFSSPDPRLWKCSLLQRRVERQVTHLPLRFQTSWAFKAARRWLTRGTSEIVSLSIAVVNAAHQLFQREN